jgi:predicted MFS family arabinose efflux permease
MWGYGYSVTFPFRRKALCAVGDDDCLRNLSGFRVSFLGLGAVALAAFLMLFFFLPETGRDKDLTAPASQALSEKIPSERSVWTGIGTQTLLY